MKKYFKVVVLPSLFFLVVGISVLVMTSGCERESGSRCDKCDSDYDCDDGLSCFTFKTALGATSKRCAESAGDICLNL
ncbi:MAG: hypothetical protein JW973_03035 [Bacteroidales bacterium]|nr:hypothetical protein [Bacteroidales bacterium]